VWEDSDKDSPELIPLAGINVFFTGCSESGFGFFSAGLTEAITRRSLSPGVLSFGSAESALILIYEYPINHKAKITVY
jgi:hypothetical protein